MTTGTVRLTPDWFYDGPPRQNQRFSETNVSWLLDTRMDDINKRSPHAFLVCAKKGVSNDR